MADPIYLDHHATTPCHPEVVERMLPFFSVKFGNPAAIVHWHGRQAAAAVEEARASVANFLGVLPEEVYFTSGATESNNTVFQTFNRSGNHLISSAIEHNSVLAPLNKLKRRGVEVTSLMPDSEGRVSLESLAAVLRTGTKLVSLMAANGEIGTMEPIGEIAAYCRERGIPFHTDATQAVGKVPLDLSSADLVSFSAHKFYGPKGVGGLVVRRGTVVEPLLNGGGQERKLRSGTVNVPGVVGMAAALEIRAKEMTAEAERLTALRNQLWDRLSSEIPSTFVYGPRELRLPGNLNVSFRHVEAEALILAMRRFSLSSGSACSSGSPEPSHVLRAIGVSDDLAMSSIRIGMGSSTSAAEIDLLVEDFIDSVGRLREIAVH